MPGTGPENEQGFIGRTVKLETMPPDISVPPE